MDMTIVRCVRRLQDGTLKQITVPRRVVLKVLVTMLDNVNNAGSYDLIDLDVGESIDAVLNFRLGDEG